MIRREFTARQRDRLTGQRGREVDRVARCSIRYRLAQRASAAVVCVDDGKRRRVRVAARANGQQRRHNNDDRYEGKRFPKALKDATPPELCLGL
jgi:hypothetical protein